MTQVSQQRRSNSIDRNARRSDPIPRGSLGTVRKVHQHREWAQVEVDWDNGRSLMLTIPDDCIEIIGSQNSES